MGHHVTACYLSHLIDIFGRIKDPIDLKNSLFDRLQSCDYE